MYNKYKTDELNNRQFFLYKTNKIEKKENGNVFKI